MSMTMTPTPPDFAPESKLYRPPAHYFRGCLGRFATGVAVVTFDGREEDGSRKRHGITVNSFTSVSMDPPLVLVSLQRSVKAHALISESAFTINILGAEQKDLAMHFAGRPSVKPQWEEGPHSPRLLGALAWFECTPWADYDGGDHTLFVGEVQEFGYRGGDALGFVNGQFIPISDPPLGHESLF